MNGTFEIGTSGAGTAVWQINDASNTQRTITLNSDLTVGANGQIRAGTGNSASTNPHALSIYGNITNSGSIKFFDFTDASYSNAS